MNTTTLHTLFSRIDTYQKYLIQIQKELTAIPGLGPDNEGDGEKNKAEFIKTILEKISPDSLEEVNAPDTRVPCGYRPNLFAKFTGKTSVKTIWIMSHMDIVPPGDLSLWDNDPYQVIEKNGKLFGRGTEDNQQGLVSSILAVKALRDENCQPEYDVGLAIVSDEETGSEYGIGHVLKKRPDLFRPQDLIIIPDAGNPDGTMIEIAEKSILWLKIQTQGKQTHASMPEKGINAHKAGAHLLVKMNDLYRIFESKNALYDPPGSTFEPTKKEPNVPNVNTIPGEDVFYFDCRILPEYPLKTVQEQIRIWADETEKEFGVKITLSSPQSIPAPEPTPSDAPVVLALKRAVKDVLGREARPMGIGGGTVAAHFRERHLPAACWATIDDMAHAPNEYCIIENVLNDAKVFLHIFLQK
jgi:succinyl-diaminopimelate desuccinylase